MFCVPTPEFSTLESVSLKAYCGDHVFSFSNSASTNA